jgi:hypothetical protein
MAEMDQMKLRDLAKMRWRQAHRRYARVLVAQRFMSAFFFGAALATLAAIVLGAIKQ